MNPTFPFMIREAQDIEPVLEVTFHPKLDAEAFGGRTFPEVVTEPLSDMEPEEITTLVRRPRCPHAW